MSRERMRVAFLGNMNNNHFAMARFLRDRDIDVTVLLFDHEQDHFHPSADTYDLSFMDYVRQLTWGSALRFLSTPAKQIEADLASYDILIGCGWAPAYCEKAGRSLDVFKPYGDDIWAYTLYRFVSPQLLPGYWAAVRSQRRGIAKSRVFHMSVTNDLFETQYARYKGASARWAEGFPMVHSPTYDPKHLDEVENRTHWGHEFRRLRDQYEFMVMFHGRHYWQCSADNPNAKGTDKLLRGWATFRHANPTLKAVLVTLEYGKHVAHSRALIDELGIADSVAWLPRMCRKDVMVGLKYSDVVCAEFVHSWMTSGVLYEALVLGKPILAWRDDAYYTASARELYPILNAKDPDSIAARLTEYVEHPERCKHMGAQGRRWYEEHVVNTTVDKYVAYINARATEGRRII